MMFIYVEFILLQKVAMREALLTSAVEAYRKGRKEVNATLCEDYLKLLRFQRQMEEKFNGIYTLTGKTVQETCKFLLEHSETVKLAEKFKNDHKISDKRYTPPILMPKH